MSSLFLQTQSAFFGMFFRHKKICTVCAYLQGICAKWVVRLFLTLTIRSWALSRDQRVLNDLQRSRLSCGRIISAPVTSPSPLSSQQVVSLTQSSCVSPVELTDGRKGLRGWARSKIIRPPSINHSILSGHDYLYKVSQLAKKNVYSHVSLKNQSKTSLQLYNGIFTGKKNQCSSTWLPLPPLYIIAYVQQVTVSQVEG